jgi:glycosyltransferase involved in cell wall biosynthesis
LPLSKEGTRVIEGLKFEASNIREAPLISLVVPVFNERDAIDAFACAIDVAIADGWPLGEAPCFEFVFVNDGSTDGSDAVIKSLCLQDSRVRLVSLSRNFGKEAALSAGLKAAKGDAVIPMDVDLQDPPELLPAMIDLWRAGAQVVNAQRADRRSDTLFKRASSQVFYKALNSLSDYPIAENVGDYRLFDRTAVDVLNQLNEHSRFNKGLFSWIGFRTETLEYTRPGRSAGETKWNVPQLVTLGLDGIVSSTTIPLRIWTIVGLVISTLAFFYATFLIIYTLVSGGDTPGYASIMAAVLFLGGLNLLSVGLVGEYVGRIAKQVRGRPLYVISDTKGF